MVWMETTDGVWQINCLNDFFEPHIFLPLQRACVRPGQQVHKGGFGEQRSELARTHPDLSRRGLLSQNSIIVLNNLHNFKTWICSCFLLSMSTISLWLQDYTELDGPEKVQVFCGYDHYEYCRITWRRVRARDADGSDPTQVQELWPGYFDPLIQLSTHFKIYSPIFLTKSLK